VNVTEELPHYNYRLEMNVKQSSTTGNSSSKAQLVAPYGDESDSEDDVVKPGSVPTNPFIPDVLVDFNKLACLLCKRQFPNKEVLQKHTKLSDLHKKNLEELKKSNGRSFADSSTTYRDRAKERRMKFGSDPDEGRNTLKDMYMQAKKDINLAYVEEPTRDGIKDDNVGNRMLQKMGWQEGQGLGKGNQGRTDIITTERRAPNAGLGARGVPVIDDDDRYSRARKLTLARYQELE
jgi:RNA-binding protein 5/10